VFDQEMPRQYDGLKRRKADEKSDEERVYSTREGDVLLVLEGKTVWVSEGFDLVLARKLRDAVDTAQGHGPVLSAGSRVQGSGPRVAGLMEGLSWWMGGFGMMRVGLR
jgi:hypothetical protein